MTQCPFAGSAQVNQLFNLVQKVFFGRPDAELLVARDESIPQRELTLQTPHRGLQLRDECFVRHVEACIDQYGQRAEQLFLVGFQWKNIGHGFVDPDSTDLGRPAGFVERQVSGWKKRWDLVADESHDARMQAIHGGLERAMPPSQRVSFVHNDLKLDNCMIDPTNPDRVVALFDWDMTTLGDPLIDVGTLLSYWPDPSDAADDEARVTHDGMDRMGLPTRAEIAARYGEVSGIDISQIGWYEAFAQWKTATVIQQLHHRWKVGDSTDPRMEAIADRLPALLDTAESLVA
jgi:hypothetical protein